MPDRPRPQVFALADAARLSADEAPTKVEIARIVTKENSGSNLLLGACWMQPGDETNVWSSRDGDEGSEVGHRYGPVDETYFIIRGRLRLRWDDGEFELGPDDSVYLAPGWRYHLKNVGDEPAFFVYGMTPTPQ
ncbi:MAG TPA: cupin domain-containing protein [Capillimicrobium sp.]|jgi:mannose-6-phosphate isomerase-like protein (cupin superfamily)